LVESLDRVALINDGGAATIASSGFHVIEPNDVSLAPYIAAYLLSQGAHEQILRTGSGVRYRSYAVGYLRQLLLPPLSQASEIGDNYWRLRTAAANLDEAWHAGISTIENILSMPPDIGDVTSAADRDEEDYADS
jgi:hypothetical protein